MILVWRLSVCLTCTSGLSREQRPRKSKIGTEVAHVTHDSGTTFKVKMSKVKVIRPLWLAVLAGQPGHWVSNGSRCMYDVYRVTTCRPGRGILWRPPAYSLLQLRLAATALTLRQEINVHFFRASTSVRMHSAMLRYQFCPSVPSMPELCLNNCTYRQSCIWFWNSKGKVVL